MIPPGVRRDIRRLPTPPSSMSPAPSSSATARSLSRANMDIPVVASVHTRFETYPRYYGLAFLEPVVEALLRRFYRRCDAIFAPSESMAQLLREQRMSYDVGIWSRGHRPRDLQSRPPRAANGGAALGIADDEPVDRLRRPAGDGEGPRRLLRRDRPARARAASGTRCWSIGEGPARDWFERRLPRAVFAGFQKGEDLGRAVASIDMLFNPSVTETFGNVTLEAMAAGLPVVAARATGSESLVDDGVTGRLIRARTHRALRRCARSIIARMTTRAAAAGAAGLRGERALWLGSGQPGAGRFLSARHPPARAEAARRPRNSPVP